MSRKVVIDYEMFKEVLADSLADRLVAELIDNMNDNDVFLYDVCDELQVLIEKSVPKKALNCYQVHPGNHGKYSSFDRWCPVCRSMIIDYDAPSRVNKRVKEIGYCYCGQKLDFE